MGGVRGIEIRRKLARNVLGVTNYSKLTLT
jgi:hypothetical protein